jgi:flagellar assembly protein FliH
MSEADNPDSRGHSGSGGRLPLEALSAASGFRSDARFKSLGAAPYRAAERQPAPAPQVEPEDPLAIAFAQGYAAGAAEAQAQAAELASINAAASEGLVLSFAKLDEQLEQELRQRLRDAVAALCEGAIAPLALDEAMLMRRIERAVSMLARADDERLIRLHPDDIALLNPGFAADWQILPDRTLERGALRVETSSGGIEDGPELWRRVIAEALRQC